MNFTFEVLGSWLKQFICDLGGVKEDRHWWLLSSSNINICHFFNKTFKAEQMLSSYCRIQQEIKLSYKRDLKLSKPKQKCGGRGNGNHGSCFFILSSLKFVHVSAFFPLMNLPLSVTHPDESLCWCQGVASMKHCERCRKDRAYIFFISMVANVADSKETIKKLYKLEMITIVINNYNELAYVFYLGSLIDTYLWQSDWHKTKLLPAAQSIPMSSNFLLFQ